MNIAKRIGLLTACFLLVVGDRAPAQSLGFGGRGFSGGYGPGMENLVRGGGAGTGYLPAGGGFLPYTPGPGGGLGVQSRMSDLTPGTTSRSRTMPGASALGGIGGASGRLSPLAPITGLSGMKGGSGMRSSRLLNRPVGPGPKPMPSRPPVGSYPFQIPPSLRGPASQRPAMAM